MFLFYRNQGERRYGLQPISPYPRRVWEFQIITEGQHSITFVENGKTREERLYGPVFSILGPECIHGWNGKRADVSKVMIFHFDEVDVALRSLIGNSGYKNLRFLPSELPTLQALYQRCDMARKSIGTSPPELKERAGFFEPLIYSIVAMELTLFFLKRLPKTALGPAPNFGKIKVEQALAWYESNLSRNPSIDEISHEVNLSLTHLRRLFHKIRGTSPKAAFTNIQFERVKWLMMDPTVTLEQISEKCGFGSSSAFSRAFKIKFRTSPRVYRTKLLEKRDQQAKKS